MPIYEYQCDACGERQEIMRKISDPPLKKCPLCGKSRLRKLVSAAAFRLKGGGWYETDFKDEKKQKNVIKAEESAGDKAEKAETKTEAKDAKPEKKTETATESKPAKTEAKSEAKPKKKKAAKD